MISRLPWLVARVPATIHFKLLCAFLAIVLLLLIVGGASLEALRLADRRADELVDIHRKITVYRQLQSDTTAQLYNISAALLVPDQSRLDATLRQLNQFGYDVDRLQFVAQDEVELLARVRDEYDRFLAVVNRAVELIRQGKLSEGREIQFEQAGPLAERIERLMNELVNRAESDIVDSVEASRAAYVRSRWTMIAFACGSVALAVLLGFAISVSLSEPVKQIDARLAEIAVGDFSRRVDLPNRDELGALAAHVNNMSEELDRLYQKLEAVSRHKSDFLANMSHELRTPLNAIIGFSEVLKERMFGELNDKQAEYIEDIHSSGRHLHALIDDILDLTKVENGMMELHPCRFELRTAMESAMTLVHERAHNHGIALKVEVADELQEITADERKFKQILLNLMSNAIKFTPAGGRIVVRAVPRDSTVEISVSDTGMGIAPADQEIIFERFRQVANGDGPPREGTGIGLALTREFVEMHGGEIRVRSEVGMGATFTVSLPHQA